MPTIENKTIKKTIRTADFDPPAWNLRDLFSGPDDPRIAESLRQVEAGAQGFADQHKDTLAQHDATALAQRIQQFEQLHQSAAQVGAYASLRFAADTNEANGAFYQKIREQVTAATLPLIFFELELMNLPEKRLRELRSDPALQHYRHYLETVSQFAPFRLSEAEERILEEQSNTGSRAFVRLFEQTTAQLRFFLPDAARGYTLSEILDLQQSPDRAVREKSAVSLTNGLENASREIAFIFNTLLQDKAIDDKRRGSLFQEQRRHISNELSSEVVETVMQTAESGFSLVQRYYDAKRRLLNLDTLFHYDRYAPIHADEPKIGFDQAQAMVLNAFGQFDTRYRDIAAPFFDNNWIDAHVRPGKRGGAFCSYVTPDRHPYVFLNYLEKPGDVRTLAHELGHAIHGYLARPRGYLGFHGTLPMAEVASTFAEMLVFETLQEQADAHGRISLLAEQIEQSIATIFRQCCLYRFEQAIHQERRAGGELTVARFGQLWQEHNGRMFGDSVTLLPGHALWWSYVRHFVASPFYVYAYTFGEMLALALYQRYQEQPVGFAPAYLALLEKGGSETPEQLVRPLGIRLDDAPFWQGALNVLNQQVTAFEAVAAGH